MLNTHWHIRIQVSPPVPGLKHCFGFLIVLHLHRAPQIFWTFFATFGATPHFRAISSSNPSWTNWWKRSEVLCQSAGAWLVRVPKGIQPAGTCEQRLEAAVTKRSRPRIPRKNQSPGEVVRCPALRSLLPFSSWAVESTARQLKGTTPRSAGHPTTLPWTATTTRIACFGRASVSFGNTFIGPGKKLGPGATAQLGWASPAKVSVGSTVTQDFND